jgi:single-stranded DNA-binding protein
MNQEAIINMNQVIFTGRITAEPRYVKTKTDQTYLNFYIAFPGYGQKPVSFLVTLTGGLADKMKDSFEKGCLIQVTGDLAQNNWVDKNGNEHKQIKIIANTAKHIDE